MKRLLTSLVMFTAVWSWTVSAATYYVATNGSDSNPGTLERPFASINKGAALLAAGDTLYLRGGTYRQTAYTSRSGEAGSPVTIAGYPGEEVMIDGEHIRPASTWGTLFLVEGSYVVVRNLTIKRSNWMGLVLKGHHDQAINVKSHQHMENGILVTAGASYAEVEGCEVYYNCMSNERFQALRGDWASGLSVARGPQQVKLRRNRVWNNWGEGLSSYESDHALFETNMVYDNQLNVYISDTKHCTLQGNLIYCTPGNPCANESQIGIALGDERYNPPSSDNTIINNLLFGNSKNIYYWPGVSGGGLVNVVIAYNTCVNATAETNLKFLSGSHSNTWIGNNIVLQENSLPVITLSTASGLTFSHNLWSKSRPSGAVGAGDVVANPQLLKVGSTGAGQLTPAWFRLAAISPAIAAAAPIAAVSVDFFGVERGEEPDIGACQARPGSPSGVKAILYY